MTGASMMGQVDAAKQIGRLTQADEQTDTPNFAMSSSGVGGLEKPSSLDHSLSVPFFISPAQRPKSFWHLLTS